MGIFANKELKSLHPEQGISPFQKLDKQHTYDRRSVTNNNLFIPRGNIQLSIRPCHTREADCEMKPHMRSEGCRH